MLTTQKIKEKYLKEGRIKLRIVRVPLETYEQNEDDDKPKEEYLITNLPKKIAPYEDFKELYHQRWNVETEFDRQKKHT